MSKKNRKNWGLEAKPEHLEAEESQDAAEESAPGEPALEFDAWWAMPSDKIPAQHHKEILKADFRARGLGHIETLSAFDEALTKYGIKLS